MQKLVRTSSFSLADLKNDARGVSIYLCLPQRFMGIHFRFLKMMVTLILAEMERIRHQPRCRYPVLMVLDQFAAFKRMQVIENAAAQIAGFGVRMMFIVQNLGQLKKVYKDNWQTLLGNCTTKIFFCNDDPFTRETVSKLIGDVETVRQTHSQSALRGSSTSYAVGDTVGESINHTVGSTASWSSGPQGGSFSGSVSSSVSRGKSSSQSMTNTYGSNESATHGMNETIQKRPLITPDEVGRFFGNLDNSKSLVLLSGEQPLPLKQIPYYQLKSLRGRFSPHPDHAPPLTLIALERQLAQEKAIRIARIKEEQAQREKEIDAIVLAHEEAEAQKLALENQRLMATKRRREREREAAQQKADDIRFVIRSSSIIFGIAFIGFFVVLPVAASFKTGRPIIEQCLRTWSSLLGL